ncbi:MAG: acetyl-CoA synthetase [Actinomycetota bacterium]|jgi:acetyl-CoA synthetase|nr:acetyl-CoA synthetase [Actinomycetota bacterium]
MAKQEDLQHIDALLEELRVIEPPEEFRRNAIVNDPEIYARAEADLEGFWAEQAGQLRWSRPWDTVMEWNPPWVKWFLGGRLNVSVNCLDVHVEAHPDRVAYYWEGEPGDRRTITYRELYEEVCRFANALKGMGVAKGDRVAMYLGMVPELPVAMLACARIGATHSVVFGGFAAEALRDRINDAEAKVVVTGDGAWRRGSIVALKENADAAVEQCPSIEHVVVVRRTGQEVAWNSGRDVWYHDAVDGQEATCPAEEMDAEDPLYILYTSGTTGKPKGILHTTGGYLTGVATTHRLVFDIHPETDVYWCAADVGWVTGHSYIVYGPLANGTTSIMYEGAPDFPDKERWWSIVERYKATILYTAPTAIRTFMKWGHEYPARHDLSSLRLLGSVGEPINPEAWMWYFEYVGGGRCPVVDTWWQTETGAIMITPLPGITRLKPGSATRPFPGIAADVFDEEGWPVGAGKGGYLVLRRPWPSQFRTIYGDPDRYVQNYFSRFGADVYLAGDGARRDEDGYFWLLGRIDDVMNVAGHRLSTYEIESALVDHPAVAESAVVSRPDPVVGEAIVAFVTLKSEIHGDEALIVELREHVATKIGKIARPHSIVLTDDLPKTRSGKIMRRLLRDVAHGRDLGDVTTLANAEVVTTIRSLSAERKDDE